MNKQDREDVLMIVESVLENYLAERLTKDLVAEIDQSIQENWNIIKMMRTRNGGAEDGMDTEK